MQKKYDIIVIGAGPGGYSAAIKCAKSGLNVAVIERDKPGGTCLNYGCIPSKALLGSAHFMVEARHAGLMGLNVSFGEPDWAKVQSRKDAIVANFTKGVEGLLRSAGAELIRGDAVVRQKGVVEVLPAGEKLLCDNIIIASGSEAIELPFAPFDGDKIISSKEALSLQAIPKSMVIIGGGVIGCELGCVYAAMGCQTTIVEALPSILPREDEWVSKTMTKEFRKLNLKALTGVKVESIDTSGMIANVHLSSGEVLEAEKVLVAVGRRPMISQETIDALALQTDHGRVVIDEKMRTSAEGVYAIGDLAGKTFLAHGAYLEAEVVADVIAGKDAKIGAYNLVPRAVYSFPEVASVGLTEQDAKEAGVDYGVSDSPFITNGRSLAHNDTTGKVRVIFDKATQKVLGVTILGASATEMIAAARLIIGTNERAQDVSFPHPTVSEVLKEAWMGVTGSGIHTP